MKQIPDNAQQIIKRLTDCGYEAFAVGGCVRDILMGTKPHDTDITTNATTDEIKTVFTSERIIETGIKHGTVTVMINGEAFEITTYRIETTYSDNRHPDEVIFTKNLIEDLSRRDFTMNSIAYNPVSGIVDPFGGKEDIKKGLIRCVGNPDKRFCEDSLRILRGLRFSSVLGFEIEQNTKQAMKRQSHLISNISKERIFSEFSKLICGKNAAKILTEFPDVLSQVIPEIEQMNGFQQHNFHHIYDVLTHTAVVIENTPPLLHLRLAAFFHDIAKPFCFSTDENGIGHFYSHASKSTAIAEKRLTELRCDNKTKDAVLTLVKLHDTPIDESERIIKRRLNSIGKDLFFDLIKIKRADTAGLAPEFAERNSHFDRLEAMAEEIIEKDDCFSIRHLNINGNDMIKLGLKGREIGKALEFLLEAVIEEKVLNDKWAMIELLKNEFHF